MFPSKVTWIRGSCGGTRIRCEELIDSMVVILTCVCENYVIAAVVGESSPAADGQLV